MPVGEIIDIRETERTIAPISDKATILFIREDFFFPCKIVKDCFSLCGFEDLLPLFSELIIIFSERFLKAECLLFRLFFKYLGIFTPQYSTLLRNRALAGAVAPPSDLSPL